MKLKSIFFPNFIKRIENKDGVLKIEKFKGSIKEFEISEIRKIYIVDKNKNNYFLNMIIIIAVLLAVFYIDNLKTPQFLIIILTIIFSVFIIILKNNTKTLCIKFKNKSTYFVKFNTQIKGLVLKIIWGIREINNL
jgi:hypothetical protein